MDENKELSFQDIMSIINGNISSNDILKFTNVVPTINDDGTFTVKPNKWTVRSKIILFPGDVLNLKTKIETTIGRAIVNKVLKIDPFGSFFEYDNNPIKINEFTNKVTVFLLKGDVTTDQMIKFFNNAVWLTRFSDMVIPSLSKTVLVTPKQSVELKDKLQKENGELIKNGDVSYITKVENPVLANVIENIKNDPSYSLFYTGKPSVGNNLKQSISTFSPIYNVTKGKFDIPEGNLLTGHDIKKYDSMANSNISGTYARNIQTQEGGSIVKTVYNAMNNLQTAEAGSDCKTTLYKQVRITKENKTLYLYNYMVEEGGLILLTPDNIDRYMNKVCYFRSALYCKWHKKFEICNKCCGELPYKINISTIGLLTSRLPFQMVKSSLKQFHNSTIQLTNYNIFDYMKIED